MLTRSHALRHARWGVLVLALALGGCDPLGLSGFFSDRPDGTSILTLLETDGREIRLGDQVNGSLSSSDFETVNGSYLEAWEFEGSEGDRVYVDLRSDDFDAYLYVVGPGLEQTLRDDDSGGACHAHLDFTVLEEGTFYIVASTMASETSGRYTLSVSEHAMPISSISCGGVEGAALMNLPTLGDVDLLETAYGTLTGAEQSLENGRPVQAWRIRGTAGETVEITLRSDDFDAYLYFAGPGIDEAMTNDDGASNLDSQLRVTFPQDGTYTIGAGALSSGSSGSYSLSVTEPLQLVDLAFDGREARTGSDGYGTLTDVDPMVEGRPVQAWALRGQAGQRVTIELISDDFDSYLQFVGPGIVTPLTDDDSAGDLDSRLEITLPQSGTYHVIAGALSSGSTGAYTLRVR